MTWHTLPWEGLIGSTEWAEAVTASPRTISGRVAVVDPAGEEIADVPVTSCQIDYDGEKAERFALKATLADSTWVPRSPADLLHPETGNRLRPYWRIYSDGAWAEVPMGTYWMDDPEASDAGAGVDLSISGHDAVAHYRRSGYGGRTIDLSGMTVTAALGALFDALGIVDYSVATSTATLPSTFALGANEDPWDDVTDIADMGGMDVWAGRLGAVVVAPAKPVETVRLNWQEGADNPVISLRRTLTTSSIRNRVVAKSTSSEVVPPVVAVVQDDDPGSPTYVFGPFGVRESRIESDKIADIKGAEGMARATFERWRRSTESLTVQARQRPDLAFRDLVAVSSSRAGAAGVWRVRGWALDLPIAPNQPQAMTVTMQTRTTA